MSTWYEDAEAVAAAVAGKRVNNAGWVRAHCPICVYRTGTPGKSQSLGYHVGRLRYHCFRCGCSGTLSKSPDEYEGVAEYHAAAADEPRVLGVERPAEYVEFNESTPIDDVPVTVRPGLEYLVNTRGLQRSTIEDCCIGACWGGRFSQRVVMPLIACDGSWLWFSARSWFPKHPVPYLYPTGDRAGIMYRHAAIFCETDRPLLVLEGCFDAIAHAPDAVAVLGKPNEQTQIALEAARRPVVFVLDGDVHEESWAWSARLRLAGKRAGSVRLPPGADPDAYSHDHLIYLATKSLETGEVSAPPPTGA